jgi:hypothetical protein
MQAGELNVEVQAFGEFHGDILPLHVIPAKAGIQLVE